MTKITPQQFLDSTEFKCLTSNSLHHYKPYKKFHGGINYEWKDDSIITPSRQLTCDEYDSIDWTGFDCSKPLERTG